ncbi:MAG TPA: peptidylprolyl isomerase [Bacteroidia bacterium]|jgi:peptidyl-prolyl cis-trans isomerase SurA|nr:peptidylprolyl isomerase [Bacteroidia bacterium]
MKKSAIIRFTLASIATFVISGSMAQKNDQAVLMTIGGNNVTVSEFENVYHKNNSKETAKDAKSLNEYLDLFVNFKLKVKEAEELGLDTAKAFRDELAGYRKQLAQPYLTDKDVNEQLLKETYDRLNMDVHAAHILIKVSETALPKDTLEAYNKIMKIRARILKGEDFAKVAAEKGLSDDPSAAENGGDLGYFTALQMVYPFESAAYNTKVGEVSMPVRTRYGYHIVKVIDKRKAQGEVLTAHIMIRTPPHMTAEDSVKLYTKMTEIYDKLKAGGKFDEFASQYSDDKSSAKKGGELPWFGTGRMPAEFEEAAFAIKSKGEYSSIIRTKYGWHIIKLLDKRGVPSFEAMKGELKSKVSKDSRSQVGRESLIAKTKTEYKFKENLKARDEFYKLIDTNFFRGTWDAVKAEKLKKPMFNLNDKVYTQTDFANFLAAHQTQRPKVDPIAVVDPLYAQFVDESVIAYEESRLDQKYPEFKALMQEYRDGILLFELTDQKVWSKAVKDTTGAKEFYENNKNKYLWEERADASVYTAANEKVAKQLRKLLAKKKTEKEILEELNKDSQLNLSVETRVFNKGENEFLDKSWNPGTSADIQDDKNKKVVIVVVNKLLAPTPKSYQDSKGLVTADYQAYLEKEWIESLKKKYAVQIDKTVLATVK